MRYGLVILTCTGLTACAAPPTPTALAPTPSAPAIAAAPFVVPMDPGQINCANLQNPIALSEGTNWTLGRARAAVLAGRLAQVPDTDMIAQSLAAYCNANPTANLASAAANIGV